MQTTQVENRAAQPSAKATQYRVVNHHEAGLFDSMTGATIWALKNLKDWNWRIEPAPDQC